MKRLSLILSRKILQIIYKFAVGPNIDYADIMSDKPFNETFKRKLEMVQYKAALVITCAIKGRSHDRLYQELHLESLVDRRWSLGFFSSTKIYNYNLTILSSNLP